MLESNKMDFQYDWSLNQKIAYLRETWPKSKDHHWMSMSETTDSIMEHVDMLDVYSAPSKERFLSDETEDIIHVYRNLSTTEPNLEPYMDITGKGSCYMKLWECGEWYEACDLAKIHCLLGKFPSTHAVLSMMLIFPISYSTILKLDADITKNTIHVDYVQVPEENHLSVDCIFKFFNKHSGFFVGGDGEPVTLPSDYFNQWASHGQSEDPFKDPSRVTASGFTDTVAAESSYGQSTLNKLSSLEKQMGMDVKDLANSNLRSAKRTLRLMVEMRDRLPKGSRYDDQREAYKDQIKLSEDLIDHWKLILNGDRNNLEEEHEFKPLYEDQVPNKYVTMDDFKDFTRKLTGQPSIVPDDSVSNIMPLNVRRPSLKTVEDDLMSTIIEDVENTVIGGYQPNMNERKLESSSYKMLKPVKGLPVIFNNNRLNFLTHVHSALFRIATDDDGHYPAVDTLERLTKERKSWRFRPDTQLLDLVLSSTLTSDGIVKANPFQLPIIETTMVLTGDLAFMMLDQLHNEFEREWFNTMKDVTTPKFQSKYEDVKYRRRKNSSRKSSSSGDSRDNKEGKRPQTRRSSSSDTKSVLSGFFYH